MKNNFLRKTFKITMVLALSVSLAACNKSSDDSKDTTETIEETTSSGIVTELLNSGYIEGLPELQKLKNSDGTIFYNFRVVFYNENHTVFKMIEFTLNKEQYDRLCDINYVDEDYMEQIAAIYDEANPILIDISDNVPSQEELNSYVGQTISVLMDQGFEKCDGVYKDEDGSIFFEYHNDLYILKIYPDPEIKNSYNTPKDLGTIKIKKIYVEDFYELFTL